MSDRALLAGEYVVLCLLRLKPMHGYEMMCFLDEEGLMAVCPVEQSTLYTYLRNVEARGYVEWNEERIGQRPPRKIFHLTDEGRDVVEPWLRQPVERMREIRLEFLLKLYFLAQSDPAAHKKLLADEIQVCEEYLQQLERFDAKNAFLHLVSLSKRSAAEATLGWLKAYAYELEQKGDQ